MGSKLHTDAATVEEEEEDAGEEKNGWAGNRNESSNTKGGGTKRVCVERSARWHREARFFR